MQLWMVIHTVLQRLTGEGILLDSAILDWYMFRYHKIVQQFSLQLLSLNLLSFFDSCLSRYVKFRKTHDAFLIPRDLIALSTPSNKTDKISEAAFSAGNMTSNISSIISVAMVLGFASTNNSCKIYN